VYNNVKKSRVGDEREHENHMSITRYKSKVNL